MRVALEGTGKCRALEGMQGECSVPRPHQSPDSKGLTDWAQRTDFKVEMRNRLGFLKGYGHGGGRRTEM